MGANAQRRKPDSLKRQYQFPVLKLGMKGQPPPLGFHQFTQHRQFRVARGLHLGDIRLGDAEQFRHLDLRQAQRQPERLERLHPLADLGDKRLDLTFVLLAEVRVPRYGLTLGCGL